MIVVETLTTAREKRHIMASSPHASRDGEARMRAVTREVGTLREDLRREVKRRERAVAQVRSTITSDRFFWRRDQL